MVTEYLEAPLLFLTTSSADVPTGRNARVHARSESARRSNPVASGRGTFNTFSLDINHVGNNHEGPRKRQKITGRSSTVSNHQSQRNEAAKTLGKPIMIPLSILATHFNLGRSAVPPNVNFEDVLQVAAFHIRRQAARIVHSNPERTLDALRCRQWCFVSATFASLGRSPFLDRAIACVVSKVRHVISGTGSQEQMLSGYAEALHCLREAVLEPTLHDRPDVLAATRLLAIYEMLDFPGSESWAQHIAGAAAMAKLQDTTSMDRTFLTLHAAPMFVEALLNDDDESFFESPHWRSLLQALSTTKHGAAHDADLACEELSCFTALRPIVATSRAAMKDGALLEWSTRLPLLSRAHELRARMKALVVQNQQRFTQVRKSGNKTFDVLGLCLVSLMVLDKLISALRRDIVPCRGIDLHADTQGLCCQMVRLELSASDFHPGKDLLSALQRQTSYPALTYDT